MIAVTLVSPNRRYHWRRFRKEAVRVLRQAAGAPAVNTVGAVRLPFPFATCQQDAQPFDREAVKRSGIQNEVNQSGLGMSVNERVDIFVNRFDRGRLE